MKTSEAAAPSPAAPGAAVAFSVIIPVEHGGRFLESALASLGRVRPPRGGFEVLVAGSPEDDVARAIVGSAPGRPRPRWVASTGARAARLNTAVALSAGEVFVFSDDDCVFPPEWLTGLAAALVARPAAGAVGGVDEAPLGSRPLLLALDAVLNSFLGTGGRRAGRGARAGAYHPRLWGMAVRRAACTAAETRGGLLDARLDDLAAAELSRRLAGRGWQVAHALEWRLLHHRDTTLGGFARRTFRRGRESRALGESPIAHLLLAAVAAALTASLLLLPVAPLRPPTLAFGAAYAAVLLCAAAQCLARTRSVRASALAPLVLAVAHLARGVGYLCGPAQLPPAPLARTSDSSWAG